MKRLTHYLTCGLVVCAIVLVAGCRSARRGEPFTGVHTPSSEAVIRGQVAFDTHCNGCHPGGEAGLGVALNNKPLPRGLIKLQIRRGLGAMPAFSKQVIGNKARDDIARYVVWLRRTR
jgi:mono/diheme cytochrome c family protein